VSVEKHIYVTIGVAERETGLEPATTTFGVVLPWGCVFGITEHLVLSHYG
jgi:hypothetical protein